MLNTCKTKHEAHGTNAVHIYSTGRLTFTLGGKCIKYPALSNSGLYMIIKYSKMIIIYDY